MKLSSTILAASLGVALAHDSNHGQHIPKLVGGRRLLAGLDTRGRASVRGRDTATVPQFATKDNGNLESRADQDTRCGAGVGSCPSGVCCSAEGWCGTTKIYCQAPDCQMNYGPGCDANKKPSGADTADVARPKLGSVLYGGAGIYDCVKKGDIALTFDDGPYIYTNDLLDKLKSYGAKATFFITGNNNGKGMINDPSTIYPAVLKRMHAEGHQIASHTWSHQNASQLTNTQYTNQMVWNEIALNSVLGFFPTYMRPPYSICEKNCQTILANLGYHVIYFDLDTAGYLNDDASMIQTSKDIWDDAIDGSDPAKKSFLQIEHDIHYQTVYNLTDYILTSLFANGYRAVTVGECLGDPSSNWYRTGPKGSGGTTSTTTIITKTTTSAAPTRTAVSTDGTCGNGVTCAGTRWGSCCSASGLCGVGSEYCSVSKGCQPAWGTCDGTATSTKTTTTTKASPTPTGPAVSQDGYCGPDVGQTCSGSQFGTCCSPAGKCSSNTISCLAILGCQKEYGSCI